MATGSTACEERGANHLNADHCPLTSSLPLAFSHSYKTYNACNLPRKGQQHDIWVPAKLVLSVASRCSLSWATPLSPSCCGMGKTLQRHTSWQGKIGAGSDCKRLTGQGQIPKIFANQKSQKDTTTKRFELSSSKSIALARQPDNHYGTSS